MNLFFESREGLLWVTATGQISLSDALDMFKKTCDAAIERGLDRVLVDCSGAEGKLTVIERYELGHTLAKYASKKPLALKMATIGPLPLIDGFAELVASNRGAIVATFRELHEAKAWLDGFAPRNTGAGTD
jgi:hypothetical protein